MLIWVSFHSDAEGAEGDEREGGALGEEGERARREWGRQRGSKRMGRESLAMHRRIWEDLRISYGHRGMNSGLVPL